MRRALGTLLLLLAWVPVARASAPGLSGSLGRTLAIHSPPDNGGFEGSLAALWPIDGHFSFGATVFVADMGLASGRLKDVHSGESLGRIDLLHRAAYGGAWRLDARVGGPGGWDPFASGSWGFYSVNDELHGSLFSRVTSAGFSLGGGLRRWVGAVGAVGVSLRYHRMFNDRLGRYMSAGVDWSWRSGR